MKLLLSFIALFVLVGCTAMNTNSKGSTLYNSDPSQLAARQVEVRILPVSKHTAYQAAMQAFFAMGYNISHTDENSGIISGSRVSGTEEAKKAAKSKMVVTALVGLPGLFMKNKFATTHTMTMLLKEDGKDSTQIRFKMQENGEPVWDTILIDKLWTATQREAFIEEGVTSVEEDVVSEKTKPIQ